jgi:hypothetical protein
MAGFWEGFGTGTAYYQIAFQSNAPGQADSLKMPTDKSGQLGFRIGMGVAAALNAQANSYDIGGFQGAGAAARTGGRSTQSQTFYRGDTSGRTEFQSYARQTGGQANSESTLQAKGFDRAASDHTGSSALPPSPLISVTSDIDEARTFAGSTGSVYQLAIPNGVAVPNPAPIEPGEHFVPHYIPPSWIVRTVK